MRKLIIPLILVALLMGLGGCVTTNGNGKTTAQPFIDTMKAENEFIEEILANTKMSTIYAEVCFVEALLGPRLAMLPLSFTQGLQEIKNIVKGAGPDQKFTECELMTVHGIRWRMAEHLVQDAFRQYAPKVIQYLPVWMLFQ